MIKGGATLWARKTIDSEIFKDKPAIWFKIWFCIVSKVNFQDNGKYKRGEGYFDTEWLCQQTGATKDQIKKCLQWLRRSTSISTERSTRGIRVKVLNYNDYQSLENYRSTDQSTDQSTTIKKECINKNDKKNVNTNTSAEQGFQRGQKMQTKKIKNYNNVWLDLSDGEWYIDDDIYQRWEELFSMLDIDIELEKIKMWLYKHQDVARNHEINRSYPIFIVRWLERSRDKERTRERTVEEVRAEGADEFSEALANNFNMEED